MVLLPGEEEIDAAQANQETKKVGIDFNELQ